MIDCKNCYHLDIIIDWNKGISEKCLMKMPELYPLICKEYDAIN